MKYIWVGLRVKIKIFIYGQLGRVFSLFCLLHCFNVVFIQRWYTVLKCILIG